MAAGLYVSWAPPGFGVPRRANYISCMTLFTRPARSGVGALLCTLAAAVGCGGVQTGDVGDVPCNFKATPWPDIDAVPPTFTRAPRQLLAPLAWPIVGELRRPDGTSVALELEITLVEGSAVVSHSESSESLTAACAGNVEVTGTIEAVGGDVFSGTGPVRVVASEGSLTLQFNSEDFDTGLHSASDPCATAGVLLALRMDDACSWVGDWSTAPPRANPPGINCGLSPAPLGTFAAAGHCT